MVVLMMHTMMMLMMMMKMMMVLCMAVASCVLKLLVAESLQQDVVAVNRDRKGVGRLCPGLGRCGEACCSACQGCVVGVARSDDRR
jgi:hypothetical protein